MDGDMLYNRRRRLRWRKESVNIVESVSKNIEKEEEEIDMSGLFDDIEDLWIPATDQQLQLNSLSSSVDAEKESENVDEFSKEQLPSAAMEVIAQAMDTDDAVKILDLAFLFVIILSLCYILQFYTWIENGRAIMGN